MNTPRKYQLPQPARRTEPPAAAVSPAAGHVVGPPVAILSGSPAPEILTAQPLPRLYLHVTLTFSAPAESARVALAAATFGAKLHALDRLLRLALDPGRCSVNGGEALLVFVPRRWGVLEAERIEEIKPQVRDLAVAAFDGAEVKAVEVVKEHRS